MGVISLYLLHLTLSPKSSQVNFSLPQSRPYRLQKTLRRHWGFTLLELLVVLVIMGIMLGAVSLTSMQSDKQILSTDAQRLSLLLQLIREEAIVRNRPTAFEANQQGYQFLELKDSKWMRIEDVDTLRPRNFSFPAVRLDIQPNDRVILGQLRIVFGREPVSRPFILNMQVGVDQVAIHADGVGHFTVEQ